MAFCANDGSGIISDASKIPVRRALSGIQESCILCCFTPGLARLARLIGPPHPGRSLRLVEVCEIERMLSTDSGCMVDGVDDALDP